MFLFIVDCFRSNIILFPLDGHIFALRSCITGQPIGVPCFVVRVGRSFAHSASVMVYWVMANIDPIPDISAKNFFHLFSELSHSSGMTSVAPT